MEQLTEKRQEEQLKKDVIALRTAILLYSQYMLDLQLLNASIADGYSSKMSVSYGIESIMPKGDPGERVDPLDAYIDRKDLLRVQAEKMSTKINRVNETLQYAYDKSGELKIDRDDMELIHFIKSGGSMRAFAIKKGWSPNKPQYRFKRAVRQIIELKSKLSTEKQVNTTLVGKVL